MTVSEKAWRDYAARLARIDETAARKVEAYLERHGTEGLLDYTYAVVTAYGEMSAALACEMYDTLAELEGEDLPPAEPAPTATYPETAKAVNGTLKYQNPELVGGAASRLTKMAGADTMLKNAIRDGGEYAWIPGGDSCVFCLTLAANGWQRATEDALKGNHADHIHAHCDCTYAVRWDGKSQVAGYDPEKYREMYDAAEGDTAQEKINSLRREQYAKNREERNARQRAAYAARKGRAEKGIAIPREKLTQYALNPDAAPDKARAFREALGYTLDNYEELYRQIAEKADIDKMTPRGHNDFGEKFEQIMLITGSNGKMANVCTAWIQENGKTERRLTSVYVTKKKAGE